MTFHDKLGSGISRFAGGFADFLTGDRYDFDKRGPFTLKSDADAEDDDKKMGKFDYFVEGLQSYNPEKNKSKYEKFLDKMASRGFASGGGGSYGRVGDNLFVYNPDNTAREQAILQQNQQNMIAAQQKKEQKSNVGRMAGAAIGNAIVPGVGGVVGGLLGGLFCDIRLKEDIAPLCKSEVNDVLSECAFFVKDLNECS